MTDKKLWELIEPVEQRIANVLDFLECIDGGLTYEVVPISDMFGPTQTDPDLDLLVISAETEKGGHKVNEVCTYLLKEGGQFLSPALISVREKLKMRSKRRDVSGRRWHKLSRKGITYSYPLHYLLRLCHRSLLDAQVRG